jgi:hypothetical protein
VAGAFKVDHEGIGDLAKDRFVRSQVRTVARMVQAEAKARAHVDTGAYRDSIQVQETGEGDRTKFEVVAGDWKAAIMESKYRTLGTSADAGKV